MKIIFIIVWGFVLCSCGMWTTRGVDLGATTNVPAFDAIQIKFLMDETKAAELNYLNFHGSKKQQNELWTNYRALYATNSPKIFSIARQQPQSEVAFAAFSWLVTNRFYFRTARLDPPTAIEYLRDGYATNTAIAPTVQFIGKYWNWTNRTATEFLRLASEQNPDRGVRGQATLALGKFRKNNAECLVAFETQPIPNDPRWAVMKAYCEDLEKSGDSKTVFLEAGKLFREVLNHYADCPSFGSATQNPPNLGEIAKSELFELEHLEVGAAAPEMAGENLDGKKLQLSDYRGKVIMISFWASWCGPCMQMVPFEHQLAERLKDSPFVLVGVDGDTVKADAIQAGIKEQMFWPSFWSLLGSDGPIPKAWNIHSWPTVYILDAEGVIQLKFEGYGGTDTERLITVTVDKLIAGMKK